MAGMPPATVEVSAAVVRALLRDQQPHLAGRSLVRVANGWDNATFRLGDDLAVRLPRRDEAVPLIVHEQQYLPGIARRTPVPVPVPVHAGRPTSDFPWPWSIVRWVPGVPAVDAGPADRAPAADGLAAFLAALHSPADAEVPVNPGMPWCWRGSGTGGATRRPRNWRRCGSRPARLQPGTALR